jgi:uncharacterized membrane protein
MAIFLLLLEVSLADIRRAGAPMIGLFLLGSVGTALGVAAGMGVVGGPEAFGEHGAALGGMFVGTYTGGSINFNALALHYGITQEGVLYTGAVAVDSIMTAIWMVVTLAIPRGIGALRKGEALAQSVPADARAGLDEPSEHDRETTQPFDLALLLALSSLALWSSVALADLLAARGVGVPSILILTTEALVLAQIPAIRRLTGSRLAGMLGVYLFLAVIGAYCDLGALAAIGDLGGTLFLFATVIVIVHGALTFGAAALLRIDKDVAAVASQANIGGSTSALALARSLGRGDLVLPGILVGSIGNAVGTYLGFAVAGLLA